MTYIDNIITNFHNNKNSIFYKTNINNYFNQLKDTYNSVYISEPLPVKAQLIKILEKITNKKVTNPNKKTVQYLKESIIQKLNYKLIIWLNHFEKLTKASAYTYKYLTRTRNIIFVANLEEKFSMEVCFFFKKFMIINKNEYEIYYRKNEINVTYALYLILSILCFVIYIKFTLSTCLETIFLPVIVIGGVWFAFLVFRTLIFTGGKV